MMRQKLFWLALFVTIPGLAFAGDFSISGLQPYFRNGMIVTGGITVLLILWEIIAMFAGRGGGRLRTDSIQVNIVEKPPEVDEEDPIKSLMRSQASGSPLRKEEEAVLPSFLSDRPRESAGEGAPMRGQAPPASSSEDADPFKALLKANEAKPAPEQEKPAPRQAAPTPPPLPPKPAEDDDDPFKSLLKSAKKDKEKEPPAAKAPDAPQPRLSLSPNGSQRQEESPTAFQPPEHVASQDSEVQRLSLTIPKKQKKTVMDEDLEMFGVSNSDGNGGTAPVPAPSTPSMPSASDDDDLPAYLRGGDQEPKAAEKKILLKMPGDAPKPADSGSLNGQDQAKKKVLSLEVPAKEKEKKFSLDDAMENPEEKPKRLSLSVGKKPAQEELALPGLNGKEANDHPERGADDALSLDKLMSEEKSTKGGFLALGGDSAKPGGTSPVPRKIILNKAKDSGADKKMFEISADIGGQQKKLDLDL